MLRVIGWNVALLLAAGLALVAAGELWLRATRPFPASTYPRRFVPDIGLMHEPHAELRRTNDVDFWTVSYTNRLGFADREPVSPARAAAGCHIAVVGDSFVEAREVPIAEKLHVRLEALAGRELPQLDIVTSAFGHLGFAPVNELAFYDVHVRRLHPRVLVLVFTVNDLWGNSPLLRGLDSGWDPDHLPFVSARRGADGAPRLLPPDPDASTSRALLEGRRSWALRTADLLGRFPSWHLPQWLHRKLQVWESARRAQMAAMVEPLRRRPRYAAFLDAPWWLSRRWDAVVRAAELPGAFEDALALAGFALDEFRERARRDGVSLVILATHLMGGAGDRAFDRLRALAAARGIPLVDQHDHILRRGGRVEDAHWPHDGHWNAAGHRWAAEALLEHLRRHTEVCDPPPADARGPWRERAQ